MKPVSISAVVACHTCPLRYYLEREMDRTESVRYTISKQLSYHLGREIEPSAVWEEVLLVSPDIDDPETEKITLDWAETCMNQKWKRAIETDVKVTSKKLGIYGVVDRILDEEPYFAIVRSSEAPEAGVYGTDRIRIACYTVCVTESLDLKPVGGLVEYVASGVSRLCIPQPRDRRAALRAIKIAHKIVNGFVPSKSKDAPCEHCYLKEYCGDGAKKLSDMM